MAPSTPFNKHITSIHDRTWN
jgi:hypothetical protein